MIKLGKLTDYGLVLMTWIARSDRHALHTARDLAATSRVPLPTVSKLLKQLLQSGLLLSHRGVRGGYLLAKDPREISLAEIIVALDGPIAFTDCSSEAGGMCELEHLCPIRDNQRIINQVVRGALENVSLADLVHPLRLTNIKNARGELLPIIGFLSGRTQ